MNPNQTIKVLVVDDSTIFRETIIGGLQTDKRIEVVGSAKDPFEARDKILSLRPDVLTLDIELPKMDGISFLKKLMPQYPIPTVVVSCHHATILEALQSGAVDFIKKPLGNTPEILDTFIQELIVKIKIASMANVSNFKNAGYFSQSAPQKNFKQCIIAIGASTGGTEAINEIIRNLPQKMPPILIVQHMPETFTKMYADRLNSTSALEVKEACDGDLVLPGRVLIAPGSFHMKLIKKENTFMVTCFQDEKVNGHRPSVDVLFHSVAQEVGSSAIGVILTGMGYDGAKGLLAMKKAGALTLGQDEDSCIVYGMPKVAYDIGGVSEQLPLNRMAQKLFTLTNSN